MRSLARCARSTHGEPNAAPSPSLKLGRRPGTLPLTQHSCYRMKTQLRCLSLPARSRKGFLTSATSLACAERKAANARHMGCCSCGGFIVSAGVFPPRPRMARRPRLGLRQPKPELVLLRLHLPLPRMGGGSASARTVRAAAVGRGGAPSLVLPAAPRSYRREPPRAAGSPPTRSYCRSGGERSRHTPRVSFFFGLRPT